MRLRKQGGFSIAERVEIVKEAFSSEVPVVETARKYGLKSGNIIYVWRHRYVDSKEISTFAAGIKDKSADEMQNEERSREELELELASVKKELEWSKLQNLALNTLIDIAEEQGIRIRKKSGAKQ